MLVQYYYSNMALVNYDGNQFVNRSSIYYSSTNVPNGYAWKYWSWHLWLACADRCNPLFVLSVSPSFFFPFRISSTQDVRIWEARDKLWNILSYIKVSADRFFATSPREIPTYQHRQTWRSCCGGFAVSLSSQSPNQWMTLDYLITCVDNVLMDCAHSDTNLLGVSTHWSNQVKHLNYKMGLKQILYPITVKRV